MSDLDDLNKRVEEIYQVLIQNGQAEFLETYNIADKISRKVCLIALYTDFSIESKFLLNVASINRFGTFHLFMFMSEL